MSKQPTATQNILNGIRERHGFSEAALAVYLGVPVYTVRKWLNGTREPGAIFDRLIYVLGIVETMAPAIHEQLMPGNSIGEGK